MSVATASLNDTLPSSVPKLDATGLHWAVFSLHFEDAVQVKGFWGHFSGTTPSPSPALPSAPTAEECAAIEKWEKDECSARSLLTCPLFHIHVPCTRPNVMRAFSYSVDKYFTLRTRTSDRKSTRLNSSHLRTSRMPSSA